MEEKDLNNNREEISNEEEIISSLNQESSMFSENAELPEESSELIEDTIQETAEISQNDELDATDVANDSLFSDENTTNSTKESEQIEDVEQINPIDSNESIEENIEIPNNAFEENIEEEIIEDVTTVESENIPTKKNISPMVSETDEFEDPIQELITVRPVKFQQFEDTPPNRSIKKNLDIMQDIPMHVSVELGRTKSSIREVMEMEQGSIIELDKIAGEQVEIYVNEKLIAKGEVIVIEDKFGVRVTSTNIIKPEQNF